MRKVNVAVIGAGYWGRKIISEYAQMAKGDSWIALRSVCDPLEENLRYCENNFDVPLLAQHYKEVLTNQDVDAVNLCTPNETHYELCKEALEAGKHVLVEKPMTLSSGEAYKLVDLAHSKNLVLSVGHIFRFNNALRKVRDLVKSGFFGDIFWLKFQWTTLMPPIPGRDVVTDLAPHPFDISNFLLNTWPSKITCRAKAYRRDKLEEMAYILAEFDNNVLAHFELSWLSPGKSREVCLMGSAKFARIDCLTQNIQIFENDHSYDLNLEKNNTIEAELEHFVQCIQNNRVGNHDQLNQNNGTVGARVVRLLEAARLSNEQEQTQKVNI
jgi:UDP-N-acetylglucosamine 3-dehydrogenase